MDRSEPRRNMSARLTFLCFCLLACVLSSPAFAGQGPGGEVIRRPPPPVDEAAAARAAQAARLKRQAAIRDQVELALKQANAAAGKYWNNYSSNLSLSQEGFYEAEAAYKRAAKLNPNDWRAFSGLAGLYTPYHYDESVVALRRAVALKPNDLELNNSLGWAAYQTGHYQEAAAVYERSIRIDASAANTRAFESLAMAYEHLKLYDKAIATLKRQLAIGSETDQVNVHGNLARIYLESGGWAA